MLNSIAQKVRGRICDLAEYLNDDSYGLGGYCGIAAVEIWRELKKKGIKSVVELGHIGYGCHCWTLVNNKIVDVTATQFKNWDGPEVEGHEFKEVMIVDKNHPFYQKLRSLRKKDEILQRRKPSWVISPISKANNLGQLRYMFKDWTFGPFNTEIIDGLKDVLSNDQKLRA